MTINNKIKSLLSACIILSMHSCYYDKEELLYPDSNQPVDCTTVTSKFAANVLPLITTNCATTNCHDASAAGGLIFQNYSQVSAAIDRINTRAVVEKSMPSAAPLQPAQINIIKCWIANGALNN